MCSWKWQTALILFALVLQSTATAQISSNRLCLHNGGEYYVGLIDHNAPNNAGGKFFPSYNHVPAEGISSSGGLYYPWKIRGWAWSGMQNNLYGATWEWASVLQYDVDPVETFKRVVKYITSTIPHFGAPSPLLFAPVPNLGGTFYGNNRNMLYPSSYGGFDPYLNIFAMAQDKWIIPSTQPFESWEFSYLLPAGSPIYVNSNFSIYEYVWENVGAYGQYLVLSGDELDCAQSGGGNKGKNYSIGKMGYGNYFYYYENVCVGARHEWAMCLLVDDAVSIPVNTPGAANAENPFASYGFDVGTATISPNQSSGAWSLMIMTEDYKNPGTGRVLMAASPYSGGCVPYGPMGYRIPHAFDYLTSLFLGMWSVWQHTMAPAYPGCMLGTTVGGHSMSVPAPANPTLVGLELYFSTFSMQGKCPSAGYLVTFF
ncbi:MAG: hypothetical protein ABIK28_25450 [Planctomycetota bacterium]